MATYTQTVHKPFVRPSRTYDYLYDPNFTVSSEHDHAKQAFKAHTNINRIRYVPQFQTMFSVLRHYPRQGVTLDSTDPVPRHVPRMWRGYSERHHQSLLLYKKCNYAPDLQVPQKTHGKPEAGGRNRYKYFRRPIIPFLPQMPPNVLLAPTRVDSTAPPGTGGVGGGVEEGVEGGVRSVGVQTIYRDSETQTDPYCPEYLVRPGSQPELLTLASLCYGQGLPAGLAEVEMIERARQKRRWEETLPPLDDPNQAERRRNMMEEQERKEWEHRENEIKLLQEERMAMIEGMLKQREADHQALNERRLEHLWSKHRSEGERKLRRLRANHVKSLRQLSGKADRVTSKKHSRKIIHSYTNYGSEVYAPMTRTGVFLDAGSERNTVHSQLTSTLDGLLALETSLPAFVTQPRVRAPERGEKVSGLAARQKAKLGRILDQVHNDIITERETGQEPPKPLRLLQRIEKPVPRPPTPTCPAPGPGIEEREQAIILLQRVLRGRSKQAKLYAGKEQRADLIRELRTTHALQSPEQGQKKKEKEEILSKQAHKLANEHREAVVSDAVEEGAALCVGQQLDFLQKELERLQEERRMHAFLLLAERQRRMREAEESGQRQREERLRRIHDELFKQTVRVHSGTVDSYLEEVILHSVHGTADQQARLEVRRQADTINTIAHQFVHTEVSGKELAAELVYSFLLPEVEKQATREKVQHDQRRHLLAAHRIIHSSLLDNIPEGATSTPPATSEGTPQAISEGATSTPQATSEGATSTPQATSEGATSTPPATSEGTPQATSEGATSTPQETSESTTSMPPATNKGAIYTPQATSDGATSTPQATSEVATSTQPATCEGVTSTPPATSEGATSTPQATSEGATSTPQETSESATSMPPATNKGAIYTPQATSDGATSTPQATSEVATSTQPATCEGVTSTPPATSEGATSTPQATSEGATSTPQATSEVATSTQPATCEGATSTPQATSEGATSTSPATSEGATSTPQATSDGATSTPQATSEVATSTQPATCEGVTSTPPATSEGATSTPQAISEGATSTPPATSEGATSTPQATSEGATSTPPLSTTNVPQATSNDQGAPITPLTTDEDTTNVPPATTEDKGATDTQTDH